MYSLTLTLRCRLVIRLGTVGVDCVRMQYICVRIPGSEASKPSALNMHGLLEALPSSASLVAKSRKFSCHGI